MKIAVIGLGYVGLSSAILFSQNHEVVAYDTDHTRVDLLNKKQSSVIDKDIEIFLEDEKLNLRATSNLKEAYVDADFIIIATPTNYDDETNFFDTNSVEETINLSITHSPDASIVIKSTIPIGFVTRMRKKFKISNIFFSPEFLREGKALHDNLYPDRIVVGDNSESAKIFANLLHEAAVKKDINVLFTSANEAEAIKLFSNTYLAMRVAFFNELDSYAIQNNMHTKQIIDGVCQDHRIGDYYNNPSFGYGGYCLPKDTKQLLANYSDVPQDLISAVVTANSTRKDFLAHQIIKKSPQTVGIYRLVMKTDSDNYRNSSIQGIINRLVFNKVKVIIFEPELNGKTYPNCEIENDLLNFKAVSDIIVANRFTNELKDVSSKVFTRDIFGKN
jgi:UDPglucose 6-dehydrogenase